jgi:hypothetical protein
LLGKRSTILSHSTSAFWLGMFEIGSHELFSQAGFEP